MVLTVLRRPFDPGFAEELPLIVAIVELQEEPEIHFATNLLDCSPEEVSIGMPVRVAIQAINDEVSLPFFRPIR